MPKPAPKSVFIQVDLTPECSGLLIAHPELTQLVEYYLTEMYLQAYSFLPTDKYGSIDHEDIWIAISETMSSIAPLWSLEETYGEDLGREMLSALEEYIYEKYCTFITWEEKEPYRITSIRAEGDTLTYLKYVM